MTAEILYLSGTAAAAPKPEPKPEPLTLWDAWRIQRNPQMFTQAQRDQAREVIAQFDRDCDTAFRSADTKGVFATYQAQAALLAIRQRQVRSRITLLNRLFWLTVTVIAGLAIAALAMRATAGAIHDADIARGIAQLIRSGS